MVALCGFNLILKYMTTFSRDYTFRMANDTNAEAFRQFLQQLPYYIPPVVIANLINLLFFICLLGAVEIFPLLFSLVMGRGPMGMSSLSRAAVSPVIEPPPIVSKSNEQHDVEVL